MVGRWHTSQCESFLSRREGEDGAMGVTRDCTAQEGEDRAMAVGGEESTMGVGQGRVPEGHSFLLPDDGEVSVMGVEPGRTPD